MKNLIRINWKTVGLSFFALFIFYLAGSYINSFLLFPFLLVLFFIILSIIHLVISHSFLRYYQEFSTEHPVKGEGVNYSLTLTNSSAISLVPLSVRFKVIQPGLDEHIDDFEVCLKPGEQTVKNFHIACPYRGVYTVGLEALELSDLFGWVKIRIPVFFRTFYVYPRVLSIDPMFSGGIDGVEHSHEKKESGAIDFSLFLSLRSYRPGESVRHIAWKKFAALGIPYIQTFDKRAQEGLILYLDLRRKEKVTSSILSREDCSIEILTALVYYFLQNSISVEVRAFGESEYHFTGQHPSDFKLFYRDTMNLFFGEGPSPAFLYELDNPAGNSIKPGLFISHEVDPDLFALIEHHTHMDTYFGLVLNQMDASVNDRNRVSAYLANQYEQNNRIICVKDSGSIEGDLNR